MCASKFRFERSKKRIIFKPVRLLFAERVERSFQLAIGPALETRRDSPQQVQLKRNHSFIIDHVIAKPRQRWDCPLASLRRSTLRD